MFSPQSFRYQIVLSFSIIFIVLWGGSIFLFNSYLARNFHKAQQLKFTHDKEIIHKKINNLKIRSQKILNKISSQIETTDHRLESIKEIWNTKLIESNEMKLSYYDSNHIHTEISKTNQSFFFSPLVLEKTITAPYTNLLEGGHFFNCKNTCRFHYIKPASNHRFDQGILQISLSISKITRDILEEITNSDIFVLKKKRMEK